MLRQISVKNFTLIEKAVLDLTSRLVMLTGETGAGKSILIDALRFVLGERLDAVRCERDPDPKAPGASVEAVFEMAPVPGAARVLLEGHAAEGEDLLILRREVTLDGKSKASINGRLVNISQLRAVGSLLVDFHGQYDHQILFDPSEQLGLVDRYGGLRERVDRFRNQFAAFREVLERQASCEAMRAGRERELDLLKYQIQEIERIDPSEGEDEALRAERSRLANAEKLGEAAREVLEALDEGDTSSSRRIQEAAKSLGRLIRLDETQRPLAEELESLQLAAETLNQKVRAYSEGLSVEEGRLEEIETRLDELALLKKKYGPSVNEILGFLAASRKRYDELANAEVFAGDLAKELAGMRPGMEALAREIRNLRGQTVKALKQKIESELRDLGLTQVRFEGELREAEWGPAGADRVEFMVSLNAGQELVPLRKVASAGEISRVLLAFKRTLAKADQVPVLVFDEIDANIGGRLGKVVGEKLRDIASERQVICITHLPQIASFGGQHVKVVKTFKAAKTVIRYETLSGEERVRELSQMMSGKEISEASQRHAEAMLEQVKS